jgi:hypothetical protein
MASIERSRTVPHVESALARTRLERAAPYARLLLALIRGLNGLTALLVPTLLLRRMGLNPRANGAAVYFMHMFGVRTAVIAGELLLPPGPVRAHAVRVAAYIHTSDAICAVLVALQGQLPPRIARTTVVISGLNAVLAWLARGETRRY